MPIKVISRAEARAKGFKRYFTAKPCPKAHISERYVSRGTCCECNLIAYRESYGRDPELHRDRARRRRREHPEKVAAEFKRWYDRWMLEKPGANVAKTRRWLASRPGYRSERRKNDPNFRIADTIRSRVRQALFARGARKSTSTIGLLGCSIAKLRLHLERKFLPGMTWRNYGYGDDKWHIDHVRPIASFRDLADPAQQRCCFHYSNLQPLWQPDNLRKGAKLDFQQGERK